jgi:hypothetical protein
VCKLTRQGSTDPTQGGELNERHCDVAIYRRQFDPEEGRRINSCVELCEIEVVGYDPTVMCRLHRWNALSQ